MPFSPTQGATQSFTSVSQRGKLHGEPGQAAVGLRPGLVHLALELLELPEDSFLLLPRAPVLLLALPEASRDPALGGCD